MRTRHKGEQEDTILAWMVGILGAVILLHWF